MAVRNFREGTATGGNYLWSTVDNWVEGFVPVSGDTVIIDSADTCYYDVPVVAAPTISVTSSGTTVTVTITGTSGITYYVLYQSSSDIAWTVGGNRSGSGTVAVAGLSSNTVYYFTVYGVKDELKSLPSPIVYKYIEASTVSSIEQAIYSILENDVTTLALVSTRIYPNHIPQAAAAPMIAYFQITGDRDHVLGSATGYVTARFQLNLWDDDYAGSRTLANAVRNALDDYAGMVGSVVIHRILIENERDISNFPSDTQLLFRYGKVLDFTVWFNE
jgi:hypothetical protein